MKTTLELRDEEVDLLRDLAESAYGDLREEIYKTEATDYKSSLRKRKAILEAIVHKLASA